MTSSSGDHVVWWGERLYSVAMSWWYSTSIKWWLTTSATTQCGSQGSLKNWTQNESLLNHIYLNWIWDLVLDHTSTSSCHFSFSYASSPSFVFSLLLTLLLAFFLQCFSPSFNYLFVICFLFTIILLFVTFLRFISYYFAIFPSFFLRPSLSLSTIISSSCFYSFYVLSPFFILILLHWYIFSCAFSLSCRVLLRISYLFFLVPSSLYRLLNTLTCTLFVVRFRRVIITKIENCYFVLTKKIQTVSLNNRISALYCVRLTAMEEDFD